VERGAMRYEGKAKKIYATSHPDLFIVEFKDQATAFDGKKRGIIHEKGICNARISALLFKHLAEQGVPTHFVEMLSSREMLVKGLDIIPVEVVARNVVAGSLAKRLGQPEGTPLPKPVLEFYYKSDALGDPMINEYHVDSMGWATGGEMQRIKELAWQVNQRLSVLMEHAGLVLVDFKLEFGRHRGEVLLGDEISPDTCRLWDAATGEKLDKDRFRRDLGGVEDAYREVLHRVERVLGTL